MKYNIESGDIQGTPEEMVEFGNLLKKDEIKPKTKKKEKKVKVYDPEPVPMIVPHKQSVHVDSFPEVSPISDNGISHLILLLERTISKNNFHVKLCTARRYLPLEEGKEWSKTTWIDFCRNFMYDSERICSFLGIENKFKTKMSRSGLTLFYDKHNRFEKEEAIIDDKPMKPRTEMPKSMLGDKDEMFSQELQKT